MADARYTPDDPLGLEAVDREIRINEMAERAKALGGGADTDGSERCRPETHEEFLRNITPIESGPFTTCFERLEKAGVALPPPDSMDGGELTAKLWEVVAALARFDTYLFHTDHLSDRELYEELWSDCLREPSPALPPGSGWVHSIDLIGSGSERDIQIGLRYYDDEESRRHWAQEFPGDTIPPHEDPLYDRDRRLPRAPEPPHMEWEDPDDPDAFGDELPD